MNLLNFKLLILGFMILLIGLYLYIIIKTRENFNNITPITNLQSEQPISTQLLNQIASKLKVSVRRIQNLTYSGDISKQILAVSFTILDPNVIEIQNGETNAQTIASNANNLFIQNQFIVQINGVNIMLSKINQSSTSVSNTSVDNSIYFNNTGLQDISNYAQQKYREVPNDASLTNFYNLKIDSNYKINPVLE